MKTITTNELTPAQVAAYEAQASAGKAPVHPGWYNCIHLPFFNCQEGHALLTYRVYKSQNKHGGPVEWLLCTEEWKPAIATFTCESAAKLAAEDLLRIDTACLHEYKDRIHQLEGKLRMRNKDRRRFDILVYTITGNKAHLHRKADTKEGLEEAMGVLKAHEWLIGPKWKPGDRYFFVSHREGVPHVEESKVLSVHDYGNGQVVIGRGGLVANRPGVTMYRRRADARRELRGL